MLHDPKFSSGLAALAPVHRRFTPRIHLRARTYAYFYLSLWRRSAGARRESSRLASTARMQCSRRARCRWLQHGACERSEPKQIFEVSVFLRKCCTDLALKLRKCLPPEISLKVAEMFTPPNPTIPLVLGYREPGRYLAVTRLF